MDDYSATKIPLQKKGSINHVVLLSHLLYCYTDAFQIRVRTIIPFAVFQFAWGQALTGYWKLV
jgi:hypothetical protein